MGRGRHRHQFRAPHLAPARVPAAAGRRAAGLGDPRRCRAPARLARAFAASPADIFREHARLSGFENGGARVFDISALAEVTDAEYDALAPVQWPCPKGGAPAERMFANGGFATPSAAPASSRSRPRASPRRPRSTRSCSTPAACATSGTMTRTGLNAAVGARGGTVRRDPAARPAGASRRALALRPATARRCCVMLARLQQRALGLRADPLVGQNSSAIVRAAGDWPSLASPRRRGPPPPSPEPVSRYGFVLTRTAPAPTGLSYWAQAMPAGFVTFIGFDLPAGGWPELRDRLLPAGEPHVLRGRAQRALSRRRAARGRLEAVLYLSPGPTLPSLEWLKASSRARRSRLPSGAPCWRAARSTARSTRDRSCACAIRSAASASKRRSRRAPWQSDRRRHARRHQLRLLRPGTQAAVGCLPAGARRRVISRRCANARHVPARARTGSVALVGAGPAIPNC